ncbi:uncharacterized protein LOC119167834 isoform X2 [Rhipicephalus microplus]|uniref:uncharacterized protein LOC119167834 isoform X2 n=1 Tax=Rhipicephalus microplus TaxID=6941 RepID=UPI003F6D2495
MSSMCSTSTTFSSSSESSDTSTLSFNRKRNSRASSQKQPFIRAANAPLGSLPSSAVQEQRGPSATSFVGSTGCSPAQRFDEFQRQRHHQSGPSASKSSSKPRQRLKKSLGSLPKHRALSLTQQNFPDIRKWPQDQRGDRKGHEEEEMIAAEFVPGGGGHSAAARAIPATGTGASTSPSLCRRAASSDQTSRRTIRWYLPAAQQPIRPRLVLSEKGLTEVAREKSTLSHGAATGPSSTTPAASGAEGTVEEMPDLPKTRTRKLRGAVDPATAVQGRRYPVDSVEAVAQQRRPSIAFAKPSLQQGRRSSASAWLTHAGRRASTMPITGIQKVLPRTFPPALEARKLASGSQSQPDKVTHPHDDESSSSSTSEDSATPPAPPLRRPSVAVKAPDMTRRRSIAGKHTAPRRAPGTKLAGSSKPRQGIPPTGTPPREPEKRVADGAMPSLEAEKAVTAEAMASTSSGEPVPPASMTQLLPSAVTMKSAMVQKSDAKKTDAALTSGSKSTWWAALTRPFTIPALSLADVLVGPYEEDAAAPAQMPHARRHSTPALDNQRGPGRSSVKMKRAAHGSDDPDDIAAVAGDAVGGTGAPPARGPLAAGHSGRPVPGPNDSVDYLDFDYFQWLQQNFENEGSEVLTHHRRRRCSLFGLCARCLVLVILVCAATSLLIFTFHLGQTLTRNIRKPNTTQTSGASSTSSSAVVTNASTAMTKTTTVATTSSTEAPLPPTEDLYDDLGDRDPTCPIATYPARVPPVPVVNRTDFPYNDSTTTQYRKLLCVVDSRYFSPKRRYALNLLPTAYCSEIIFSAVYVNIGKKTTVYHKRPIDVEILKDLINLKQTRTHRGDKLRLHVTLGGERKDSPNFVETLEKYQVRDAVVEGLYKFSNLIDGVNVHWDRPGDQCDQEFTAAYFRAFLEALYLRDMSIILTVPPVLGLARKFWLMSVTRYVDYVIVTTHLLRRQGVLDCSGRRQYAAASYLAIRDHVLRETANPFQAAKVVYSIALGADVFRATLPLSFPMLLDAGTPSSVFDGPTIQPNKTSYDHVCRMPKGVFDGDSECVYAIRQTATGGAELALYAGPEELAARMRSSYYSKIGDTTVAVYDMYLDDFGGNCMSAGGATAKLSPLVAAIAETGL